MIAKYDLTVDDLIAYNLYHNRHSAAVRRYQQRVLWLPTVFLLLFSATLWVFEIKRNPTVLGPSQDVIAGFCLSALYFITILSLLKLYVPFRLKRTVRAMFAEGQNKGLFGPQQITLGPDEISTENGSGKTSRPWKSMERIAVADREAYLYVNAITAVIVPRRAFATDADFNTFVETARQYMRPVVMKYSVSADGQITLEYELTRDDLVTFGVYGLRQSSVLRSHTLWNILSGLVLLMMFPVMVCVCVDPQMSRFLQTASRCWALFLIAPASALICLVDWKFFYPQRLRDYLASYYSECCGLQKVTVKPEGLLVETSSVQALYFWGSFKKVEVREAYTYLYVKFTSAFIVPRNVFPALGEFDNFVEMVRGYMQESTRASQSLNQAEDQKVI